MDKQSEKSAERLNAILDAAEAQFLALAPEKRREALTVCEEVLAAERTKTAITARYLYR